jgi:hypothetical protein
MFCKDISGNLVLMYVNSFGAFWYEQTLSRA